MFDGEERHLYAKLEFYNVTGSIKDRLVNYVLDKASLSEGTSLVEATSGNTGIALAAYGARNNNPVTIFMPDFVSKERVSILKLYGADVILVSHEEGGFKEAVKRAREFSLVNDAYLFNQFSNEDNVKCHFNTTGLEIARELGALDKFVSGIGTGGTLIGAGTRLKETFGAKIVAVEPDSLPILKDENATGSHKIDGIGDDFLPSIVDKNLIDEVVDVNDLDAICMARKLCEELGLGVGVSSGANFLGSVLSDKGNEEIVTVFADDNKKYLSVFSEDVRVKENFISERIKLVSYSVVN